MTYRLIGNYPESFTTTECPPFIKVYEVNFVYSGNIKLTLKGFLRLELLQNKSKVVRPQAADTGENRAGASVEKEYKSFHQ